MLRRTTVIGGLALWLVGSSLLLAQQPRGRFGRRGPSFGRSSGDSIALLGIGKVQEELSITEEQKGLIEDMRADLREQWRSVFEGLRGSRDVSEEEREKRRQEFRKKTEEISKKTEDMLKMVLEPKQLERLGQLQLQREGTRAFGRPKVAEKLGLSEEQRSKLAELRQQARGPDFRDSRRLSPEERRELFAKAREEREKVNAQILAVLTPEQKQKWGEMQGEKFEFPRREFRRGGDERRGRERRRERTERT